MSVAPGKAAEAAARDKGHFLFAFKTSRPVCCPPATFTH
jgi:hypothetical protein